MRLVQNLVSAWSRVFLSLLILGCIGLPGSLLAAPKLVTLATTAQTGTGDNGTPDSINASMSGDGSKIVFQSKVEDFSGGNTDFAEDIFLWSGGPAITLITTEEILTGTTGNSVNPVISDDGSTVVFETGSTNLISSPEVQSSQKQLYVYSGGVNKLLSYNFDQDDGGNGSSSNAALSSNGSKVVFQSDAQDLLAPGVEVNSGSDIFLIEDVSTNPPDITLISKANGVNKTGDRSSTTPRMNSDGSCVVFESTSNNLATNITETDPIDEQDIFLWQGGSITMISHNATNTNGGNLASSNPWVSDDCLTVVFESQASDLVAGVTDTNGAGRDVFVWRGGVVSAVSISFFGGATAETESFNPSLSSDGLHVVFESDADDIVDPLIDTNDTFDIFLSDLTAAPVVLNSLVSYDSAGTASSQGGSRNARISKDGKFVAFENNGDDLVDGLNDTNGTTDVFLRDLDNSLTSILSVQNGPANGTGDFASFKPKISNNGGFTVFESSATNLVAVGIDQNDAIDLFRGAPAGIVQFSDAEYAVNEADLTVTITVERSGGSGGTITVDYTTADDSATQPDDYQTASGTLTWNDGDTAAKTFDVTIQNDTTVEDVQIVKLTLSNPTGGASLGADDEADLKITSDDEDCDNNQDDNGNGLEDCQDSQCDGDPACTEICDGGQDEDEDGLTDCQDTDDCEDAPNCNIPEDCAAVGDEDNDGLADCNDPECSLFPACIEDCSTPGDDDGNGLVNCLDPDCIGNPICVPVSGEDCGVAGDEDGDGFEGCLDSDCWGAGCAENCSNPGDEDQANGADCADPACDAVCPDAETNCADNVDNDLNGQIDCQDGNCASQSACLNGDGDAVPDGSDNCPGVANSDQLDTDGDGTGNVCDTTEGNCSNGEDDDNDGASDCYDLADCENDPVCINPEGDSDGDGVLNTNDNCPGTGNANQLDSDSDTIGDACDQSEGSCNNGTSDDQDGLVDCADPECVNQLTCNLPFEDFDSDTFANQIDNCPSVSNDQTDTDNDGVGNACDLTESDCDNTFDDNDDGFTDCLDPQCSSLPVCAPPPPDGDSDGAPDATDNCPANSNADQADEDSDGLGNVCDPDFGQNPGGDGDGDGDGGGDGDGDGNNNGGGNVDDEDGNGGPGLGGLPAGSTGRGGGGFGCQLDAGSPSDDSPVEYHVMAVLVALLSGLSWFGKSRSRSQNPARG